MDAIGLRISKNEVRHINESLKTKAIITPKLLIKDHKILTSNGDFPTRLVIPEKILSYCCKGGLPGFEKHIG